MSLKTGSGARQLPRLLVGLSTLAASLVLAAPAPAAFPGSSGRIAFVGGRDGNAEIYAMNADGTRQTRLTNHAAEDYGPIWSPDGGRIVFVSARDGNAEIYVMNADGTGQTRLTDDAALDVDPTWSPDGTKILFTSDRLVDAYGFTQEELYTMNPDGSGQTRLTSSTHGEGGDCAFGLAGEGQGPCPLKRQSAWSPDGSKIAFIKRDYFFDYDGDPPQWTPSSRRRHMAGERGRDRPNEAGQCDVKR